MAVIDYDDFANIKKQYSQTQSVEDIINYVFAGGAAAKLLLDSKYGQGLRFRNVHIHDFREHKDIEVYAFNDVFGQLNKNRHDICGCDGYGPLYALNYEDQDTPACGIFIEILRGNSYFGFIPPSHVDIRVVRQGRGTRFFTLSPEFITASKIFNPSGIRKDIDDIDALKLLQKFEFDQAYFHALVSKTPFGKRIVIPSTMHLEQLLEKRECAQFLRKSLLTTYSTIPNLEAVSYNALAGCVSHEPHELKLTDKKESFLKEIYSGNSQPSERMATYALAARFILRYFPLNNKIIEWISEDLAGAILQNEERGCALTRCASQIGASLQNCRSMDEETAQYSEGCKILKHLSQTPFLHVWTAKYLALIQQNNCITHHKKP